MKCCYVNTDSNAREDPLAPYDLWFHYKMAFAGDYGDQIWKHSTLFAKLEIGDVLFVYRSRFGNVGVGNVIETWDQKVYRGPQRLLYWEELFEYRVAVVWFVDWGTEPKSAKELGLPVSPAYFCEINPDKYEVIKLLEELR